MRKPVRPTQTPPAYLPPLPGWVIQNHGKTLETETFLSGASLAMLHMVLVDQARILPAELLRNRLALRAAEACLKLEGRRESEADIRDAYFLVRAGDAMGPAGEMYARWRKASATGATSATGLKQRDWLKRLKSCVPEYIAEELPEWIDTAMDQSAVQGGSPVAQAAKMVELVIAAFPREEAAALICGDLVLARALGWAHPVPLLGLHIKRRDLQAAGDELSLDCHRAVARGAQDAVRLAHDLTRRAQRLRNVAPKLRAKGSGEAVALFLCEDAVLPSSMLSPRIQETSITMTDRAARRLCDRLVELGVVRS